MREHEDVRVDREGKKITIKKEGKGWIPHQVRDDKGEERDDKGEERDDRVAVREHDDVRVGKKEKIITIKLGGQDVPCETISCGRITLEMRSEEPGNQR
jgi:hypothetical protein